MENLSKLNKFIFFLTVLFFIIWSGSYISKYLLIYQFFEPTLELKPEFTNVDFTPIFRTISSVINLNVIVYPAYFIFLILFIIVSKLSIKNEGWLFIILAFTILTAPFEFYSLFKDYQILMKINNENFDNLISLIKQKIIEQNSFPIVQFLFIIANVFLLIFKPLHKKVIKNEN